MTASVQSVEQIINIALDIIGYPRRVGDIFEGTRASKVALDTYAETRDEVLRMRDWGFANRSMTLSVLKSAPANGYSSGTPWSTAYPPIPYLFEYTYPADAIRILYIYSGQMALPNNDPLPVQYKIANDPAESPPARVILTNQANAVAVYTGQITDMTTWEPLFVDTLTQTLAKKFASLGKTQNLVELAQAMGKDAAESEQAAEMQDET